jgi:RNA-directed DNA polymerase
VLALIKAFLKAGIMTEHGDLEAQLTGTPQGGILSPLMANIALTALDEHYVRAWEQMGDQIQRAARRRGGEPNYRITRYAEALIAETEQTIPLGLTLSAEKTGIAHIDEGIDFLGWRIQRHQGSHGRRYVYTYPSKRALASIKTKVKAITQTDHQQTLDQLIHRLNPVLRGCCAYFRPGVSSQTFNYLRAYIWQRVVRWLRRKHPKTNWRWLRRRYLPGWWPTDGTTVLFDPGSVSTTRYRYRGNRIPTPWESGYLPQTEPGLPLDRLQRHLITERPPACLRRAGCAGTRTSGSAGGSGKRTG